MFGGQGPGKADNWRAGPREGGQVAGRAQGRRTTGGQGPGKADNWRAGSREGGRAGSREGGQLAGRVQGEGLFQLLLFCIGNNTINCTFYSAVEIFLQKWPFGMFFGPRRLFRFWSKTRETDWADTPGLPRRVIPVRFK